MRAQARFEQAAGCKVLSMIEITLAEARRRGWNKMGVLGFPVPQVTVYSQPLKQLGLGYEIIDGELQARLNAAVLGVMEGRFDAAGRGAAREAVASLRSKGVDGVILGCTEIPLLLGEEAEAGDLINPLQLLAEAAVRYAVE